MVYEHDLTVRMYDTDAAGILYFGNQFRFFHDAFEALTQAEHLGFQDLFERESFIFVIVHAESDYLASLKVGDDIKVHCWVSKIGNTSFTFSYDIYKKSDQTRVGQGKTVHVCLDKETRKKRPLPDKLRSIISKYQA